MQRVSKNVKQFITTCAKLVSKYEQERFEFEATGDIQERSSPIEQLFETALLAVIRLEDEDFDTFQVGGQWRSRGIDIWPQYKIGNYKVDYALSRECADAAIGTRFVRHIVVELDGHAFHDKDEKQRRYEKRRDRYIQKLGYKVFRYTGSEIVQDPFNAAIECVAFLVGCDEEYIREGLGSYDG